MDLTSIIGVVIGVVLIVFVGIGPKDLATFGIPQVWRSCWAVRSHLLWRVTHLAC